MPTSAVSANTVAANRFVLVLDWRGSLFVVVWRRASVVVDRRGSLFVVDWRGASFVVANRSSVVVYRPIPPDAGDGPEQRVLMIVACRANSYSDGQSKAGAGPRASTSTTADTRPDVTAITSAEVN